MSARRSYPKSFTNLLEKRAMMNFHGRLLVVDDDPVNRLRLSRFLQQQKHTVMLAENGRQALEMISEQPFDLILLDIIMAEMDGYQVLEHLKDHNMLRHLPVIVISALDEREKAIQYLERGAEDYLLKPFEPTLLNARISICLEKKRLRDQEVEYLKNVTLVTRAAAAVEANTFDPASLADVALRQDELGRLARVFTGMVREVHAREEQLREAHAEMQTLNQAKTRMIDHLSHELKTPLAIIAASSKLLRKPAFRQNDQRFCAVLDRIDRYLQRLLELETEASDIADGRHVDENILLEAILRQGQDLLTVLFEDQDPPDALLEKFRQRLEDLYADGDDHAVHDISLHRWIPKVLRTLQPVYLHRDLQIVLDLRSAPSLRMPEPVLYKIFCGLVRNAIEHTPDGGTIRIQLVQQHTALRLVVQDFGVGIDEQLQKQLFHGFVHSGDTNNYSSGTPYDFGAGGQGLDLLRTKLSSERWGFQIGVESQHCMYIQPEYPCPGEISACRFCTNARDCQNSGGSLFTLEFPASILVFEATNDMQGGNL